MEIGNINKPVLNLVDPLYKSSTSSEIKKGYKTSNVFRPNKRLLPECCMSPLSPILNVYGCYIKGGTKKCEKIVLN